MNWKNILIGGFGLYWLLGKAGTYAYEQVEWSFDKVHIFKDVHVLEGGFDLRLVIKNKLPTSISFSRYYGEIFRNNTLIATIDTSKDVTLPAGQTVTIPVFAKVKGLDILTSIAAGNLLAPVTVNSYVDFVIAGEVFTLPVSNTINLFYVS